MTSLNTATLPALETTLIKEEQLQKEGFLFLPAEEALKIFSQKFSHLYKLADRQNWESFFASWDHLETDRYMADGGSYRKRRYSTFTLHATQIRQEPHQPHYQSRDYNNLNGGVERWFAPLEEETLQNPALSALLMTTSHYADALFKAEKSSFWHTELHQFRIETGTHIKGKPTPEGLHRDGVDFVFIMMIKRENISQGITTIYALDQKTKYAEFTLENPFDTALINDHQVFHGVSEIEPIDPSKPAYRDVLVITLTRKAASSSSKTNS